MTGLGDLVATGATVTKTGTICSVLQGPSGGTPVFTEVHFTDGEEFGNVAADPYLARFLEADRAGRFTFLNAMGRGILIGGNIQGVGRVNADVAHWRALATTAAMKAVAACLVAIMIIQIGGGASPAVWALVLVALGFAAMAGNSARRFSGVVSAINTANGAGRPSRSAASSSRTHHGRAQKKEAL